MDGGLVAGTAQRRSARRREVVLWRSLALGRAPLSSLGRLSAAPGRSGPRRFFLSLYGVSQTAIAWRAPLLAAGCSLFFPLFHALLSLTDAMIGQWQRKKKEKKRRCESPFATRFGKGSIARHALVSVSFFFFVRPLPARRSLSLDGSLFFLSWGGLFFSHCSFGLLFWFLCCGALFVAFFWCAFFLPFVAPVRGEICFVLVFLFSERSPSAIPSVGTCVAAHTTAPN
nr:hypothetical protein [Pandoravirus belohorizontensis]